MAAIRHELWIDAPVEQVWALLGSAEGVSCWWDHQSERETPEGTVWEHTPGPAHGTVRMRVVAREPNTLLQWTCISTHDAATPASEWTGTTISFRLGPRESSPAARADWARRIPVQTVLSFTHEGWPQGSRFLAFCTTAWAGVLQKLADCAVKAD
ncbi:SRPBCC domain-containing protein [Xenophilus sp. Marseille-Q4582]|uniref:SRPBCC family protein n=1 Tax=Xenophilus sp. Marseille-Q4582 TaxID=2866600 RepID=UPI001CE406FE|nr:SRPBCC domain-containing protein [Xenophilus sp. Marseille-Q4582]